MSSPEVHKASPGIRIYVIWPRRGRTVLCNRVEPLRGPLL